MPCFTGQEEIVPKQLEGLGCCEPQIQLMVQMERLHVAAGGLELLKFAFTQWRCLPGARGKVVSEQVGVSRNVPLTLLGSGWLGCPGQPLQQPLYRSVAGGALWWIRWSL